MDLFLKKYIFEMDLDRNGFEEIWFWSIYGYKWSHVTQNDKCNMKFGCMSLDLFVEEKMNN